jgi:integrase
MASVYRRQREGKSSGNWFASWNDCHGRRQTKSTGTTDKAAAKRIAHKWEADSALRREAVIDSAIEATQLQSVRLIEEHLKVFVAKMKTARRTSLHIEQTCRMIRRVAEICGWTRIVDISADGLNRFSADRVDAGGRGSSARTIERHIVALKSFTNWLVRHDKLTVDPLKLIHAPKSEADRRLVRRMLLPEEWSWLKSTLVQSVARFGMTGHERLLLYWLAIETGLRSSELRSLKIANLYLDDAPAYVTVASRNTKDRQAAKQFIGGEIANALKTTVRDRSGSESLFTMPAPNRLAKMVRADLSEARKAWLSEVAKDSEEYSRRKKSDFLAAEDHNGENLDLHALRHTCGAWLAKAGVRPQVIQAVMRHSTITLTMDTYGHLFPDDRNGAVDLVQPMLGTIPKVAASQNGESNIVAGGYSAYAARPMRNGYFSDSEETSNLESGAMKANSNAKRKTPETPGFLRDSALEDRLDAILCEVVRAGIEPATHGFSVHCSTN